jgi:probable rRNA maturation factor
MRVKENLLLIDFHFTDARGGLKDRRKLKSFLAALFKREKKALASLTYIFCSDKALLDINQQFLQHDYYTDIITFNLAPRNHAVEGEIYISLDRVRENALNLDEYFYRELHRVIFHGALHLCGYKDKTNKDLLIMRTTEDFYLKRYFM